MNKEESDIDLLKRRATELRGLLMMTEERIKKLEKEKEYQMVLEGEKR